MPSKTDTQTAVDLDAFASWAAKRTDKFTSDDVASMPRLMQAARTIVAQWQNDPGKTDTSASINRTMLDFKAVELRGQFLTLGQARAALNIFRARAQFAGPRVTVTPTQPQVQEQTNYSTSAPLSARVQTIRRLNEKYSDAQREADNDAFFSRHGIGYNAEPMDDAEYAFGGAARADAYAEQEAEREQEARGFRAGLDPMQSFANDISRAPQTGAIGPVASGFYTVCFDGDESDRITLRVQTPNWMSETDRSGKQAISYLRGPDNATDYTGVAFLIDGTMRYWRSCDASAATKARIERAVHVIASMDADGQAELGRDYARRSGRCRICGHTLTVPSSIDASIGPTCAKRIAG